MIEIINKPLLLHLVGYLYYWQMGFNSVFKGLREWADGKTLQDIRNATVTRSVITCILCAPCIN